ncbi:MAG: 3-oxoacid CoA-transferase subunit B [Deltaproteobacteria bacterium]|nr:3-oxoacid CoA-transferase subunit B [Candidatus Zymogenaceae bacterium]
MKERMSKEQMARRVARELKDGFCVNLGIGMPMLVSSYLPPGAQVLFQAENGVLGVGSHAPQGMEDKDLGNAGDEDIMVIPGASFFDSAESFAMIRGEHLDVSVLGGFQVSEKGDLANWKLPNRKVGSYGGGMDLASGAKKVIIMMKHTTPQGEAKIVTECTYPLTARRCVSMVVTDVAVIEITEKGLLLRETAPGWTIEDVQEITGPRLITDAAIEWAA